MPQVSLLPAALLVSGLVAAPATAQNPPIAVFSAELSLVNVAVTVEDERGEPIQGLSAKDFVLSEDGRRRTIEMCARMDEAGGGPGTSLDVALLVDTSESMLETLRRSQEAAVRFLSTLPNAQELIVVLFDQYQRVERFDRENPQALFDRLAATPDGGNTALRDAVVFAIKTLGRSNGRSALVLLTDGIDSVSSVEPLAMERAVQSTAVTVYPVAFPISHLGPGTDPREAARTMERLASISGGRLFRLASEKDLPGVLDEIVADLRAQYVLGFAPETDGVRGRLRKVSVKVPGHKKAVIRHRVGYRLQ